MFITADISATRPHSWYLSCILPITAFASTNFKDCPKPRFDWVSGESIREVTTTIQFSTNSYFFTMFSPHWVDYFEIIADNFSLSTITAHEVAIAAILTSQAEP